MFLHKYLCMYIPIYLYTYTTNIKIENHMCGNTFEFSKKTYEVNKMTENIVKVDTKSFQDMCQKIINLEKENKQLKADNKILGSELTYFKEYSADLEEEVNLLKNRCRTLTCENHDLSLEIKDMKFTRKFLTSEDAGKRFAQELLGHTITPEEVAIEAAEDCYVPYNGDDF